MSAKQKISTIFQEIQHNGLTHQKRAAVLLKLYDAVPFEDFILSFMHCVRIIFNHDVESKYVLSCIKFAAGFIAKVTERDEAGDDGEDAPTPPLLRRVIMEVLKFHDCFKQRYHACNFITILLDSIGENANLDNDLCDEIQGAMLDRILDQRIAIRVMSIEALQRLQDVNNNECPVLKAYLNSLRDPSPKIRTAVIKAVAPCLAAIPKIVESVHDESASVRLQAFAKLAHLKPAHLPIVDRQAVLRRGFEEDNKQGSKVFREVLLEKWLAAYNGNYLLLLKAIKLDADEQDVEDTNEISNDIIEEFLKTHAVMDLLNCLPLDENKLIPHDKLLTEVASFWNVMFRTLSKREECEEVLTMIVPDLLPFCKYVERYITENNNSDLEAWKFLEYQFVLLKLFDMIRMFDTSDEAGRKVLHQLVTETLLKCCLRKPVIKTLLCILENLNPDIDSLIKEVVDIIKNLLNPIVEVQPSKEDMQELNFMLAELDVKINILNEDVEEAIAVRDMELAYEKEVELKLLKARKTDLQSKILQCRQEKKQRSNKPTHKYKSFDILNSLLELKSVTKLNGPLKLIGAEMLAEMETFVDAEHRERAFYCCCLNALLNRECAEEYLKTIYSPVLLYRSSAAVDIATVQRSMMTICDLLLVYGPRLFKQENNDSASTTKRRLYNPDIDEIELLNSSECSLENLLDIIISMLASDVAEIKETAGKVLVRFVYSGVCVSSAMFSRVLIEWCNPVNVQEDPNMQTMLGVAMFNYAQKYQISQAVIENSVIPALSVIGNAPKTSPLADVNIDHVIAFICNLTTPLNRNSIVDTHKTLAYMLCNALDKSLENKCAIIWAKMLLALEPPHEDRKALEELKCQVKDLLEDVTNGAVRNKLRKYVSKLTDELNRVSKTILEVNSNVETTMDSRPDEQNKKRSVSGSGSENDSPRNPKKKSKPGGVVVVMERLTRNSVKRVLKDSRLRLQEEKRQCLHDSSSSRESQNCAVSGEEVEVDVRSNGVKKMSVGQAHDKENMLQRTSIIIITQKDVNKSIQLSDGQSPDQNNDGVMKSRLTQSKANGVKVVDNSGDEKMPSASSDSSDGERSKDRRKQSSAEIRLKRKPNHLHNGKRTTDDKRLPNNIDEDKQRKIMKKKCFVLLNRSSGKSPTSQDNTSSSKSKHILRSMTKSSTRVSVINCSEAADKQSTKKSEDGENERQKIIKGKGIKRKEKSTRP